MSELGNQMTSGMGVTDADGAAVPVISNRRREKPCYTNGRTSNNTYLVGAVNEQFPGYTALGIRRFDDDRYKLHFWPNIRAFNLEKRPEGVYSRGPGNSNGAYEGCMMDRAKLTDLLNELRQKPEFAVAPDDHVLGVLQRGYNPSEHFTA